MHRLACPELGGSLRKVGGRRDHCVGAAERFELTVAAMIFEGSDIVPASASTAPEPINWTTSAVWGPGWIFRISP